MKTGKKCKVSFVLVVMLVLLLETSVEVRAYSGSSAVSYAASHMSSNHTNKASNCPNSWLCAEFVSKCLQAGGLGNGNYTGCRSLYNDLKTRGTVYILTKGSMSSGAYCIPSTGNAANLKPGDAIISYCATCNVYKHAALVSKSSGGYIYTYEHNRNRINGKCWISSCSSGHSFYIYGIHFPETVPDTIPPAISNVKVTNVDNTGYTVTCTVTDNSGSISRVQFPTWTEANGQDDLATNWGTNTSVRGTMNGNQVTFRVNVSEHNNEGGRYWTHIYAYDNSGNYVSVETGANIDRSNPVISNVRVTDVTADGYTVLCEVIDESGINRVQFPTWTVRNGQDDIDGNWWSGYGCAGTWIGGNTYSFHVYRNAHNDEIKNYRTHIYAFDSYGNYTVVEKNVGCLLGDRANLGSEFVATIQNNYSKTVLTNDGTNVSGRVYKGNSNQQWIFKRQSDGNYRIYSMAAPEKCLDVCDFKDCDGNNIQVWTHNGTIAQSWTIYGTAERGYYFVPKCSEIRALDLNGGSSEEGTNVQLYRSWDGYPQKFSINYLSTSIKLSNTELKIQKGESKTITAQITPSAATNKNIVWSSSNESVATVVNGNITAKSAGTAVITATTQDSAGGNNQITAQCKVIVNGGITSDVTDEEVDDSDDKEDEYSYDDENDDEQEVKDDTLKPKALNTMITLATEKYIVTSSLKSNPTVEYYCNDNNVVTVAVPDKITLNGVTYKVTSIRKNAFKSCKKLKKVTIGKNVKTIGESAFEGCTKLEKVTIQSTVLKKIGKNAFRNDKKLKTIIIKSSKLSSNSIGKNAIKGTNKNLKIKAPAKKVKAYQKYFRKKGNSRVKVKKW